MSVCLSSNINQPSNLHKKASFLDFSKKSLPYSIAGTILWGINQEILKASPLNVVLYNSYAFQTLAVLCIIKSGWEFINLFSRPMSSRNIQKLVATQEEVDSLRAEISRLQQELAARQGLAPVGTGSVPHSQSIAGAADTSVSQHVPHEPGPVDQRPPQNWVI